MTHKAGPDAVLRTPAGPLIGYGGRPMSNASEPTTSSTEQNDSTSPEHAAARAGTGRHGCPDWCVAHLNADYGTDDHYARGVHRRLEDWMFTATPHAWEDGGFAVLSTVHVQIEAVHMDSGERAVVHLPVTETKGLAALLTEAARAGLDLQ